MAKDYRPVSAEAQVEALRTLVAAVTATSEGASRKKTWRPACSMFWTGWNHGNRPWCRNC